MNFVEIMKNGQHWNERLPSSLPSPWIQSVGLDEWASSSLPPRLCWEIGRKRYQTTLFCCVLILLLFQLHIFSSKENLCAVFQNENSTILLFCFGKRMSKFKFLSNSLPYTKRRSLSCYVLDLITCHQQCARSLWAVEHLRKHAIKILKNLTEEEMESGSKGGGDERVTRLSYFNNV